jgi:hypothetical protein
MVVTTVTLTLSLAGAFGAWLSAAGIGALMSRDRFEAVFENFRAHAGLTFLGGAGLFAIGVAIVIAHNHWTDPLAIFVTLLGWGVAIKGLLLVAIPAPLLEFATAMRRPPFVAAFAVGAIALGLLLLALAVFGRAGAL